MKIFTSEERSDLKSICTLICFFSLLQITLEGILSGHSFLSHLGEDTLSDNNGEFFKTNSLNRRMDARYDDYWYPGCDDYNKEDEEYEDDECISRNYDNFSYPDESLLCSLTDESQYEEYDIDEPNSGRYYGNFPQERNHNSSDRGNPAAGGEHSSLMLTEKYCDSNPNVYDARVRRNLTNTDDDLPHGSYSPEFGQAALEKTMSLTSWSDYLNDQLEGFMAYSDQHSRNLVEDYCDYTQPTRQQRRSSQVARVSGLQMMVENLIHATKVVIFSKTYCPYCVTTKDIFDDMDQPYSVVELDRLADGDQIQEIMGQITGGTSVPRVFINGMFVGGGDDVKKLYESGELEEMLNFE